MTVVSGYEDLIKLYESENSQVYRAQQQSDRQSVILKILNTDYPTPEQLSRYQQEYELAHQLHLSHVVRATKLTICQRKPVIIFEDWGGVSLQQWLKSYPHGISLDEFFTVAILLTEGLGQLHEQGIIHNDINPANIVWNPQTGVLKIIDLGLARSLKADSVLQTAKKLEGSLPYFSPEQTGRINRPLDYRSDFYALGVTLYELLTGQLPFDSDDPLELIHCHIARQPLSPDQINPQIPPTLAAMVMKLMAKNAEDRYQSAWGLQSDLRQCRQQWQTSGHIEYFPFAQQDIASQLRIPKKLYGRDQEVQLLLHTFERIIEQQSPKELVMIAGYSGIGKSTLVRSLQPQIVAQQGHFISGKFDQYQRNIPYAAVVDAFAALMQQVLAKPEVILQQWCDRLLTALGNNGQIIIEVIPDVELIIGAQPPVAELGGMEAQSRFNLVLQDFVRACSNPESPLVLFLDDLQWADLGTLNLIERLMSDSQIQSFLLIGAYRDNKIDSAHQLNFLLDQLQAKETNYLTIPLAPLPLVEIQNLLAETLHCEPESVTDLAQLILRKTEGNPFFVNQFLQTLYNEQLLSFNRAESCWRWNLAEIEAVGFADNVVDLMVRQLQKFSPSVQQSLALAAYCGTEFDLLTLALISDRAVEAVLTELNPAITEGYLQPVISPHETSSGSTYGFAHDRIQQAAYSLIPHTEQAQTHYRIGQLLLQHWSSELQAENLFVLVNHLNQGRDCIHEQSERDRLAQFNLRASRKAKAANSYSIAYDYGLMGLDLLGKTAWQRQYPLTFALHELLVELAFLLGEFTAMNDCIETILAYAVNPLEHVSSYLIKIQFLTIQNQYLEAIDLGLFALKQVNFELLDYVNTKDLNQEIEQINQLINNFSVEHLIDLPLICEPFQLAIIAILEASLPATQLAGSSLFSVFIIALVKLSIQSGHSKRSAFYYSLYSILLISSNHLEIANRFSQLAYQLAIKESDHTLIAKVWHILAFYCYPYQYLLTEKLSLLQEGYQAGLAGGNIEFAAYNLNGYDYHAFWSGYSLKALQAQTENTYQRLLELNSFSISQYNFLLGQLIHALTQSADANLNYFEQSLNEEVLINLASQKQDKTRMFVFYIFRGIICFLWNQFDLAYQDFVQARPHISGCQGQFIEAIFYFFDSLSILKSQIGTGGKKEKPELWQRVESNQAKYQLWANHAPMNFLHKWQLVEAEKCRVLGQKAEAIEFYDQAIAGAKANQYLQEEALANELAAQFYGEWGKPKIAQVYLIEAHYGYLQWGALAKVAQLEKQYPQIFERIRELGMPSLPQASNALYAQASVLDLTTVMKASQAIAREIVLEDLLQTLMKILLKNAGAQLGYLLLSTETSGEELNNFYPAIYCNIEQNETQFKFTDSIQNILPISVLKYVIRTQTSIILNQPTQEGHFQQDPYIQALQPLSLVCFPLLNQGQLVGLVYLENNLSLGAFTTERIELLQLLSSQAAIALTNAQLYAQLKESEQQLKQFLEALPIGIGVVDGEGRPYYTNQQAIKILGQGVVPQVSADELSEVYRCYLAGTNEPYPNEKLPVYQALQGKTAYSDDIEIHHADYVIPIETWATPIYSQVGAIQYAIVALQDISERKKAEQTLHLALEKERELNSLRSQFLTMISHEFRTPLTVIGSSIGLINNYGDRLKAEQKEKYINNIQKSVQQITHLLDDIVTISQTEMNEMQCNPVVGDIVAFCKDLVKEIQQLNVGYHLDCVWNLGEINTPQSYFVAFDTRLLRQILVNLLNNAIKYSPDNPVIRFEITAKAQALIFEISDRGIGIPEEEQGSIFETFYRASNVGHIAGIGLGLAITQRCVNLYGGEISLQSRVNEGTTIRVCLPAKLGT